MSELQLVYHERTYVANVEELGLDSYTSDSRIKQVVEHHFDLVRGALQDHQVTRLAGGRILISEKAVFGSA